MASQRLKRAQLFQNERAELGDIANVAQFANDNLALALRFLTGLPGPGVRRGMKVLAQSPPSMFLTVTAGGAVIQNGTTSAMLLLEEDTATTPLDPADGAADRIDTVCIGWTEANGPLENRRFVTPGPTPETSTYATNPTVTTISVVPDVKVITGVLGAGVAPDPPAGYIKLATVLVAANAANIPQSAITSYGPSYNAPLVWGSDRTAGAIANFPFVSAPMITVDTPPGALTLILVQLNLHVGLLDPNQVNTVHGGFLIRIWNLDIDFFVGLDHQALIAGLTQQTFKAWCVVQGGTLGPQRYGVHLDLNDLSGSPAGPGVSLDLVQMAAITI